MRFELLDGVFTMLAGLGVLMVQRVFFVFLWRVVS
jgi:hypothetical protein